MKDESIVVAVWFPSAEVIKVQATSPATLQAFTLHLRSPVAKTSTDLPPVVVATAVVVAYPVPVAAFSVLDDLTVETASSATEATLAIEFGAMATVAEPHLPAKQAILSKEIASAVELKGPALTSIP